MTQETAAAVLLEANYQINEMKCTIQQQREEIARLRSVCGEAYQFAGAVGAPVKVLDNLLDAAHGAKPRHETFLPVVDTDCAEIARLRAALEEASNTGVGMIAEERQRQVSKEGWTPEHDDEHEWGQLADAASCYLEVHRWEHQHQPRQWPWPGDWWKPVPGNPIRNLVKAGALIAAEIDRRLRLDRAMGQQ